MKFVKEMDGGLTSRTTMAFGWSRFRRTTIKLQSACPNSGTRIKFETSRLRNRAPTAPLHRDIRYIRILNGLDSMDSISERRAKKKLLNIRFVRIKCGSQTYHLGDYRPLKNDSAPYSHIWSVIHLYNGFVFKRDRSIV
jgi:hypothetical protein